MTAAALLLALLATPPTCPAVARVLGPDAARAPVVAALSARGLAPGAACGWRISVRSTAEGLLISGRPPAAPPAAPP